ncbi:MAG: ADOP family duplicated permease [Gemmatimonadota bacterium]
MSERGERGARSVLRALLRLYPEAFRTMLGDDLVETTVAVWRDAVRDAGPAGAVRFWLTDGVRFVVDGLLERLRSLVGIRDDARHALRQLRRAPGFHGLAVTTIALGIGATTAMFAVADAVVFRSLPYEGTDDLYRVAPRFGDLRVGSVGLPHLNDVREEASSFVWLAGVRAASPAVTGVGDPVRASALFVTEEWLRRLGARPMSGRLLQDADFEPGAPRVVVVSHGAWRSWWGGGDVVGESIELDGVPHTVVGVMDRSYRDPRPVEPDPARTVWVPARAGEPGHARSDFTFQAIGRLRPDVSTEAAERQLAAIGARLSEAFPGTARLGGEGMQFWLASLMEETVGDARQRLLLLLGAATLLLLLACGNVANLFLARGSARTTELAVRSALGASRRRIVRQLTTESVVIAGIGGVAGAGLGAGLLRGFVALAPAGIPRLWEVGFDVRTAAFALGATAFTGLAFGLIPAIRAARRPALAARHGRSGTSRHGLRAHAALVSLEVALALVLAAGSALLLRSFAHLIDVDPGFDADDVTLVDVRPPTTAASDLELRTAFYRELVERANALPGVRGAALALTAPGSGGSYNQVTPEGASSRDDGQRYYRFNAVTPGWFAALDIPVRAGQTFTGDETRDGRQVVVINEAAARTFFPEDDSPVGRRLKLAGPDSDAPLHDVVGVVGDVRQRGLGQAAEPEIYIPHVQSAYSRMTLALELDDAGSPPIAAIRSTIDEIAPNVPIDRIVPLRERLVASTAEARFLTSIVTAFGALALLLAVVGSYATARYAVSRRVREMAIRMALGAGPQTVFGRVLLRTGTAAGVGILVGLGLTLALSRVLESYVFGITAHDPATIALACAVIGGAAIIASAGPAARAARVDPNEVLRAE